MYRGQAALEFLMTYGWAVIIIMVVVAVLFYAGIFSSGESSVKSCALPAGFSCNEFEMDQNGVLYLNIGQATGKTVTVTGLGCSANGTPAITNYVNVSIVSGSHAWVTNTTQLNCSGAAGSAFKGSVILSYSIPGSGLARNVVGTISAPIQGSVSGGGSIGGGSGSDVWVLVTGNPSLGTNDFWVMKYEAKNNGSGTPVSTAADYPWVSINQSNARAACALAGGHLLSIAETQTINLNLAAQPSNWMSGVVGTGCMYGGHMQCSGGACAMVLNASSDDASAWWNGTASIQNTSEQNCPFTTNAADRWGNETRRTYYLSNGQAIWDWSGNMHEWMNATCVPGSGAGNWYNSFVEWTNGNLGEERALIGPPNSSWTTSYGIGYYYGCIASGNAFMRGGAYHENNKGGVFNLNLLAAASNANTDIGFRCAR